MARSSGLPLPRGMFEPGDDGSPVLGGTFFVLLPSLARAPRWRCPPVRHGSSPGSSGGWPRRPRI
ncbi:hypothetical protein ACWC5C_35005 [Streptomyces sp. NPDC001700]